MPDGGLQQGGSPRSESLQCKHWEDKWRYKDQYGTRPRRGGG